MWDYGYSDMLEAILELLGYGQAWSIDNLSIELGISREMVCAAISFLEQSKYIKRVGQNNCNGNCKNCHNCEGTELLSTQPCILFAIDK